MPLVKYKNQSFNTKLKKNDEIDSTTEQHKENWN